MVVDADTAKWGIGIIVTLVGAIWIVARWLDGRFDAINREVDIIRSDCIRREDMAQIMASIERLSGRIDGVMMQRRGAVGD